MVLLYTQDFDQNKILYDGTDYSVIQHNQENTE